MLMKTGLVDIPASEYHSDKEVVGHSALVEMLRSPAHFWHRLNETIEPTPAMEFGTAVHMAVLEPDRFRDSYAVCPKFDRRTKEGKALALAWEEANIGKKAIDQDAMAALVHMREAIQNHVQAAELMTSSVTEQSYFWTDRETGIKCRIRADLLRLSANGSIMAIGDLKTTLDASRDKFARTIADRGYDLQAAFYVDGIKHLTGREVPFYLLPVESNAPHGVALYRVGSKSIEVGRAKYRAALQLLQRCRENDSWPSYQPFGDAEEIEIPEWSLRRAAAEFEEE